ncbi:ciliary microtubule associated protein 1A-like isoform X2 [Aptenodytes patagonicus]|uniref:ciliary microtubule associated protein 1A-like isoform X2 n=1 Tax=Aptenodytes patagonicus TaxID=9234 RepID=UPI003FA0ABA0
METIIVVDPKRERCGYVADVPPARRCGEFCQQSGYLNHNPTKAKAPAYTCKGAKPPTEDSCSPGPHYCVEPSMTGNGKYVAPAYAICGLPKRNTKIMLGPSDYFPEKSNSHIYKCLPVQSTSFQHRAIKTDLPPVAGIC